MHHSVVRQSRKARQANCGASQRRLVVSEVEGPQPVRFGLGNRAQNRRKGGGATQLAARSNLRGVGMRPRWAGRGANGAPGDSDTAKLGFAKSPKSAGVF